MKILVYGAGVLGSVYAARLQQSGQDVTVLARGARLEEIRTNGLVLLDDDTQAKTVTQVKVVDRLAPDDCYDLAVVLVRKNQLEGVLPALTQNHGTPDVLLMVNNAAGPDEIISALGSERVILGFPGAGGQRDNGVVRYRLVSGLVQPTTIGELDGRRTPRIQALAAVLRAAGFPVAICPRINAWLITHAAVVSPVANAIYLAGGSTRRLAGTRDGLVSMLRAIREQFAVLHALSIPITPFRYGAIEWLPEPLLVALCQIGFRLQPAEIVLARHANAARDEMGQLTRELDGLARQAGIDTPHSRHLATFLDPERLPLPGGQAHIPLRWKEAFPYLGAFLALLLVLRRRRR